MTGDHDVAAMVAAGEENRPPPTLDPPYAFADYRSTVHRAPTMRLIAASPESATRFGPVFGDGRVAPGDVDLTRQGDGPPIGERIIIHGRILGPDGKRLGRQLVEIWQANAAGRYRHVVDRHDAPLDPNFVGAGRCLTDDEGRYRFTTIKPGEYPWRNHPNAWRPAHIHFSVFGRSFTSRLVTQMYFPGDPLLAYDPMYQAISDKAAAERLVSILDLDATVDSFALGYRFDLVVGPGAASTPLEDERTDV